MASLIPRYSGNRMMKEYVVKVCQPQQRPTAAERQKAQSWPWCRQNRLAERW